MTIREELDNRLSLLNADTIAIFAEIAINPDTEAKPKWSRIGKATWSSAGNLELKFDAWPTNARAIELRGDTPSPTHPRVDTDE